MKKLTGLLMVAVFSMGCVSDYDDFINQDPSFYTDYGMAVTVGVKNNPGPDMVDRWIQLTISFWKFWEPSWVGCMYDRVTRTHTIFADDKTIPHIDYEDGVSGVAHRWQDMFYPIISYRDSIKMQHSRFVFMHELSHVFVGECGGVWDNDGSHAIFKEKGLGIYDSLLPKIK